MEVHATILYALLSTKKGSCSYSDYATGYKGELVAILNEQRSTKGKDVRMVPLGGEKGWKGLG
jgi:hypothetical protein